MMKTSATKQPQKRKTIVKKAAKPKIAILDKKEQQATKSRFSIEELQSGLEKYFGFRQFKGLQLEAIQSLMSNKDTFVIMPTGGGKSLCYQLPAMIATVWLLL